MKREELIIEKQKEVITNLKEIGQFYFALKGKASKGDVEKMRNLAATGNRLESELKELASLSPHVDKGGEMKLECPQCGDTGKKELHCRCCGNNYPSLPLPTDEEIEEYLLDCPDYVGEGRIDEGIQAGFRACAKWMREQMKLNP